jgi:hypothetical protein
MAWRRARREISVGRGCLWRIDVSHELAEEPSVVSAGLSFAGVASCEEPLKLTPREFQISTTRHLE